MSLSLRRSPAVFAVALIAAALVYLAPGSQARASAPSDAADQGAAARLAAKPNFEAPFPCGQTWTYSHHSGEVRRALDFVRSDGGSTYGTPVLASAGGTATRHYQGGGAGNYIVIDHGGGWETYYFHLAGFSVPSGAYVNQGDQIGTTGSSGNSTGAHLHYEQLYNGGGRNIVIDGSGLAYPGSYYQYYLTSGNCGGDDGGGGGGTGCTADGPVVTDYEGDSYPTRYCDNYKSGYVMTRSGQRSGFLNAGTNWFVCQQKFAGWENPAVGGARNDYWLYTQGDRTADTTAYDGWGWFPATYVSGGGNYEAVPGLPACSDVW